MTIQMRIFKALPKEKRQAVIHEIINVQALKSPRPKSFKERDQENFGRVKHGTFLPALFDVVVKQNIY